MVRLLLAGGGSVGHLSPCLAVAQELEKRVSLRTLYVCGSSPVEEEFLNGRTFRTILTPKLRRYLSMRTLILPAEFLVALVQALFIILRFKPDAILATGGPVCPSVCLAGALLRIPIVLFESDAAPGIATRMCRKFAKAACAGQEEMGCVNTGLPVREEIIRGSEDAGRAITGLSGNRPILIVLGGSQGAEALNRAVRDNLSALLELCDIIHITGKGKNFSFDHARYVQLEFVVGDIPHLLALADLALTRAGANALAELAAVGLPAIICPLPDSAQDHQRRNARRFEEGGAALVMEQEKLNTDLLPAVRRILEDTVKRQTMKENMRMLHRTDAPMRIADVVLDAVGSKR